MSRIKGRDTKPEILVRKHLFSLGFRYRLHDKGLPGKPDMIFPKLKSVLFINGCFWHHHNCNEGRLPLSNREFWESKIGANVKRDEANAQKLHDLGWRVLVVWGCELKNKEVFNITMKTLTAQLRQNQ